MPRSLFEPILNTEKNIKKRENYEKSSKYDFKKFKKENKNLKI